MLVPVLCKHVPHLSSVFPLPFSSIRPLYLVGSTKDAAAGRGGHDGVVGSPDGTAGAGDRELLVPLRVAAASATEETAYDDATEDFQDYLHPGSGRPGRQGQRRQHELYSASERPCGGEVAPDSC